VNLERTYEQELPELLELLELLTQAYQRSRDIRRLLREREQG
jgi:hypothetical protein